MQFYEVIQFVFVEGFMHCVVVSKIPSQLYKFVQLPERLKEKENQFMWKRNRNQITLVSRNLPAVSKQLNNIKSYHVSQCQDISSCFNMHTFSLLGDFCYVNILFYSFIFLVYFRGLIISCFFWISRICNQLLFQISVVQDQM